MSSLKQKGELARPRYHFTPPANWLNDPNGLVYYAGEYHLFYQYHPGSTVWGPMHWGHAVSRDLLNWQHLPVALYPDEHGQIFSGSAVVDWHDTAGFGGEALVALFTHHTDARQCQSLAYSTDRGRTWTKYPGNPLLLPPPGREHDFRDPKVFWYGAPKTGHWVMSLAAGHDVLFYTSPNLKDWQPSGSFGSGYGCTSGVWETPDLFELPVAGSAAARWVLTAGIGDGGPAGGSATQYFLGHFDGQTFRSENPKGTILWADFGADFYAAQSWSDEPGGRRLALAWMNNWQYARVVPAAAWRGVLSFPRELALRQTRDGVRLVQRPAAEFDALRGRPSIWEQVTLAPGDVFRHEVEGEIVEINAQLEPAPSLDRFRLRIHNAPGEFTALEFDAVKNQLSVDRRRSGQNAPHPGFAAVHTADLAPVDGQVRLRICLDRRSIEVFGDDGLVVFTESIFPGAPAQGLEVFAVGGSLKINRLEIVQLNPSSVGHPQE